MRLRLELVGAEVAAISAFLTIAGAVGLPALLLLVLVVGALVIQSALFYQLGRVREKLEPRRSR